ncbi:hypothetical protein [Kordia jejudonensis]|uniref:hypothetical protein n=1 Tax=Kordia jejudonensis TaxID=1348245 RepID=UPI0006296FDA|nr:hypothetical protein [Kordia jejudonensis]
MKRKKITLGLKKLNISNLQNLHTIKGAGSIRLCSDNNCGETAYCETQGGFECGETLASDCGFNSHMNTDCTIFTYNQYC